MKRDRPRSRGPSGLWGHQNKVLRALAYSGFAAPLGVLVLVSN